MSAKETQPQRLLLIYPVLFILWVIVLLWQWNEHLAIIESEKLKMSNRAEDISNTVGVVMRSQRRFGKVLLKQRIESALKGLAQTDTLISVTLINPDLEVVASSGNIETVHPNLMSSSGIWEDHQVTFVNPIDLGDDQKEGQPSNTIVITIPEDRKEIRRRIKKYYRRSTDPGQSQTIRSTTAPSSEIRQSSSSNSRYRSWNRPPWMSPEEWSQVKHKNNVNGFCITLSLKDFNREISKDAWSRGLIVLFAFLALGGLTLFYRFLRRSGDFEMRLVKADEQNTHLKDMNQAAMGLAHETKNPLNIVRGISQTISRDAQVSEEIKERCFQITNEVDRITAQLNEFIQFSRPREVQLSSLRLDQVISDVIRPIKDELLEQGIEIIEETRNLVVEADEQLLRQILFNLLLNASQHMGEGGRLHVAAAINDEGKGYIEVLDNGKGIPEELLEKVFQPYFTTRDTGTGLGLSIVKQMVHAHGWNIELLPRQPHGLRVRIRDIHILHTP